MRSDSSPKVSVAWYRSLFRHKGKSLLFFLTVATSVTVIQLATLDTTRVSPNFALNAAIGLVLAMGGAVVLAMLADRFDRRLRTPADIEQVLNIPVIATVPHFARRRAASSRPLVGQTSGLRRE